MIRRIIKINWEKCNGCGACASACHEGAIEMINGKATLTREDYCDGLGDCLPACPVDAISFEEREAPAYDEAAVKAAQQKKAALACGCPGSEVKNIASGFAAPDAVNGESCLKNWPVQIKLVPENAPCFNDVHLLIAADCSAFACGDFHNRFMRGKTTLIGCPKLDGVDYTEKLACIIAANDIERITVVRMQVPCCGGLENAVRRAVHASGKDVPLRVVTLSSEGETVSSI